MGVGGKAYAIISWNAMATKNHVNKLHAFDSYYFTVRQDWLKNASTQKACMIKMLKTVTQKSVRQWKTANNV